MNTRAMSMAMLLGAACGGGGDDQGQATTGDSSSGPAPGTTGTASGADTSSSTAPSSESSGTTAATEPGTTDDTTSSTTSTASTSESGDSTTGGTGLRCDIGEFPELWINGTECETEPMIQVHQFDPDTYILRQSLCTHFEAPFMYLLFGEDRVLLEDTGANTQIPLVETVQGLIADWLAANGRDAIELIVVNSHGHGDHTANNAAFVGLPDTTVVGIPQPLVAEFFGISEWPTQIVDYDLGGGRVVNIIPIPGHQTAHIAIYDPHTQWLLTGDTMYPGRLYISDFPTYSESIDRLVTFMDDHEVCRVMGTHIEMTTYPGHDYDFEAAQHLAEHPLSLLPQHVFELQTAVQGMADAPVIEVHDEFVVYPF